MEKNTDSAAASIAASLSRQPKRALVAKVAQRKTRAHGSAGFAKPGGLAALFHLAQGFLIGDEGARRCVVAIAQIARFRHIVAVGRERRQSGRVGIGLRLGRRSESGSRRDDGQSQSKGDFTHRIFLRTFTSSSRKSRSAQNNTPNLRKLSALALGNTQSESDKPQNERPDFNFHLPDFVSGLPDFVSGLPFFGLGLPENVSGLPEFGFYLPESKSGKKEFGLGLLDFGSWPCSSAPTNQQTLARVVGIPTSI